MSFHMNRLHLITLAAVLAGWGLHGLAIEAPAQTKAPAAMGMQGLTRAQILADSKPKAIEQILMSSRSADPFLRANAIEAMQPLSQRALPMAQLGLRDEASVVRFASLVTVGKLKVKALAPAVERALQDEAPSVRAAAIYAAKQLGLNANVGQLADMLASSNPGLRGNVVMLLGMMGDSSAIPMIQELTQASIRRATPAERAIVRLQVAEALVQLGDESSLDALRGAVFRADQDEVRVLAIQIEGRIQDRAMIPALRRMLTVDRDRHPIEVKLAAAEAMARMGQSEGLAIALQGATWQSAPVRAQAAFTLGLIDDPSAAAALAKLLDDPSEQVRLAAAAAILRAG